MLCPVFGVCSAPVVRADAAPQPKPNSRFVKRVKRRSPAPSPAQIPAEPSVDGRVQP